MCTNVRLEEHIISDCDAVLTFVSDKVLASAACLRQWRHAQAYGLPLLSVPLEAVATGSKVYECARLVGSAGQINITECATLEAMAQTVADAVLGAVHDEQRWLHRGFGRATLATQTLDVCIIFAREDSHVCSLVAAIVLTNREYYWNGLCSPAMRHCVTLG
eukprot:m.1174557 g.1174557  ORF g.1174557 m.1174557 type:complete len:162 (+) comp24521_c0_seq45:5835-6320(+)